MHLTCRSSFFGGFFGVSCEENAVLCPFLHGGTLERRASASVNTKLDLFYCFTEDVGYSPVAFLRALTGCSENAAQKIKNMCTPSVRRSEKIHPKIIAYWEALGVAVSLLEQLGVHSGAHPLSGQPCTVFDYRLTYMDIGRKYYKHPDDTATDKKYTNSKGTTAAYVFPFIYAYANRYSRHAPVLILAGEKDVVVARSRGLEAYCSAGGEGSEIGMPELFRDRDVIVCYDNDKAGATGQYRVARQLLNYAQSVSTINIGDLVKGEKEDVTDYFTKYSGTTQNLLAHSKPFSSTTVHEGVKEIPQVATWKELSEIPTATLRKLRVTVDSVDVTPQYIPKAWAVRSTGKTGSITTRTFGEILRGSIKSIAGMMHAKSNEDVQITDTLLVQKCTLVDDLGSALLCYTSGFPLPTAGDSIVVYAAFTPLLGKPSIPVIRQWESDTSYAWDGTAWSKIPVTAFDYYIGYPADPMLRYVAAVTAHSPKELVLGDARIHGHLDSLVVGASRCGKSSTASGIAKAIQSQTVISLAGSAATVAGLVGGSVPLETGGSAIKAGVLPRNNNRFVVLEELSHAKPELLPSLTDIRSSGVARITRATGSVELPCRLRLFTTANPKGGDMLAYHDGVAMLYDIVDSAEDMARYDICYLHDAPLPSPSVSALEEYPHEELIARARWAQDATVVFSDEAKEEVFRVHAYLNARFRSTTSPLFGMETWKKVARVAAATHVLFSSYATRDDPVDAKCVRCAEQFFIKCYASSVCKLDVHAAAEALYTEWGVEDVEELKRIAKLHPLLVQELATTTEPSVPHLKAATGLSATDFEVVTQDLLKNKFIRYHTRSTITVSTKFRKVYEEIKE